MPAVHVDRDARFARGTTTKGRPSHQFTAPELSKSFGKSSTVECRKMRKPMEQTSKSHGLPPLAISIARSTPPGNLIEIRINRRSVSDFPRHKELDNLTPWVHFRAKNPNARDPLPTGRARAQLPCRRSSRKSYRNWR